MTKNALSPICGGASALRAAGYEVGSNKEIFWVCRPDGTELERVCGRAEAEARANALIAKGAL